MNDELAMRRALRLALLGRHASPNPMVGCVIVDAGVKVGEGYHERPGGPHAEVVALAQAGSRAKSATVYVTLEPCSHYGRTPPCADALIAAEVGRVVVAVEDPDARVRGAGLARLSDAGIAISTGICENEARAVNAAFFKHRISGLPYVTVKIAMTLDGRIATAEGDSRWITSAITRKWVHRQLRDRTDAILVGVGTVLADDPSLTTRLDHRAGRDPTRIVLDTHLRTPLDARVVAQANGPASTIIVCGERVDPERRIRLEGMAVIVKVAPTTDRGNIDLKRLMIDLGTNHGIQSVLAEGGAHVIGSLMEAKLVDRYVATIAPKLIGGDGPGPIGGRCLVQSMSDALAIREWKIRRCGPDLVVDSLLEREMV